MGTHSPVCMYTEGENVLVFSDRADEAGNMRHRGSEDDENLVNGERQRKAETQRKTT